MAGEANYIAARGRNGVVSAAKVSLVGTVKEAIKLGVPNDRELKILLDALRSEAITRSARQQMWDTIAESARRSTISAYSNRKLKRPAGSYQRDSRLSGALKKALSNPEIIKASPTGLVMFNRDILDKEAKHWRRLNFGAGEGGREGDLTAPGQFPVTGMGMLMGLEPDPRPKFGLPKGFFIGAGDVGDNPFHATKGPQKYPTRGIAARNFLDAPMKLVAREIKPNLDRLWESQFADASRLSKIENKTAVNKLPRTLGF